MIIEIECGCPNRSITCINKVNLLKAIVSREINNHEQYVRHGYNLNSKMRSDNELEDVSVYEKSEPCANILYSDNKICKYGCKEINSNQS